MQLHLILLLALHAKARYQTVLIMAYVLLRGTAETALIRNNIKNYILGFKLDFSAALREEISLQLIFKKVIRLHLYPTSSKHATA